MNEWAYRDAELFKRLFQKVAPILERRREEVGRKLRFMEVCGTHTVSFSKTGLRELLTPYVELISGPGCPVCVTDQTDIDQMIAYASRSDVIVATFGDMMKVPGTSADLFKQRAEGSDIRMVYSASEAVGIARRNPQKKVVFLGVGFETTAPGIAWGIKKAQQEKVHNYFVYSAHKLTPPAVNQLVADNDHQLDGFLLPGHVSVIIGRAGWQEMEQKNVPAVISGFEPIDLLGSIYLLAEDMKRAQRSVVNNYKRMVKEEGNRKAQALLTDIFTVDSADWRGFGCMNASGLTINKAYKAHDAKENIKLEKMPSKVIKGCRCGEVVKGKESPFDCRLFAEACTPENPLGPCMVSSEGACATFYKYEREKGLPV